MSIESPERAPHRLSQCLLLAVVLFLLNAYVCWGLFGVEYLRHMGSIEGAYIGLSRYMLAHWHDFAWFPVWYAGIPSQNAYPPLLHWTVALAAVVGGISAAHAYHWVTALFYCLGPVSLFALALRLSGSPRAAFFSGALFSALSPSAWLAPGTGRNFGGWHPERLAALVYDGEGPHIAVLALLPLAILFIHLALERRRAPYFVLAVVGLASVGLTNWIGALALALGIAAYVLANLVSGKNCAHPLAWIALIAATAYGLALPWIPPSTIAAVRANSEHVGGDFSHTGAELLLWTPAALLLLLALKLALRHTPAYLQFAAFFAFLTALPPVVSAWAKIPIVPQPERYHLEMELALALLAGLLLDAGLRRLKPRFALLATVALLLAFIWPVRSDRHYARDVLIRTIDITTTSEWRTAQWLNHHWSGGRVMLPGSSSFWLTAFSDTPELGGGFDQGLTLPVFPMEQYQVFTGAGSGSRETEFAILWLKALGVQAVAVSGPGSTEIYKNYHHPQKFEGALQPLWRDRGDTLYSVGASPSLAHVVAASDLVTRTPSNGLDVTPLRPYVAALENPAYPNAPFQWTSQHSGRIQTNLPPNSVLSVQISWSAGWHASLNGQALPIFKDSLGFMYVIPNSPGPASVLMDYDGGIEMFAARWISSLILVALGFACVWSWMTVRRGLL